MKTVKKILLVLGSLAGFTALILQFYNPIQTRPWRLERTRENKSATVHIINLARNTAGSGVVISRSTILTAAHVARPGELVFAVFYDRDGSLQLKMANVGIWDKQSQLAILFTEGGLPPPVKIGRGADMREGDLIYTVGYPGSVRRPMIDAGIIAQRHFMPPRELPRKAFLVTAQPVPGMSGSPVFNSCGELIGIFEAMTGQSTIGGVRLWGVVSPTDPLSAILRKWFATQGQPAPTAKR